MNHPIEGIILLIVTFASFWWVFSYKDKLLRAIIVLFLLFFYMYCGFGVVYSDKTCADYELTYVIYVITLSLSFIFFLKKNIGIKSTNRITRFSFRWATVIVFFYLFIKILPLIEEGKLINLISPPPPLLNDMVADTDFSESLVSSISQTIDNFVCLFYYIALYKYVKNPVLLSVLILLPVYIGFCSSGYISRSGLLFFIAIIYFTLYYFYPKTRKWLIAIVFLVVPSALIYFVQFESIRLGEVATSISIGDAIEHLLRAESSYVSWYDDIANIGGEYVFNYLYWLITLPLPGFLKPLDINMNINALFTADVFNIPLSSITTIALPGLVNEGVFVFGRYLFPLHAIIFSFIFTYSYLSLRRNQQNFVALMFLTLNFALITSRAGTNFYSIAVKMMFVIWIFNVLLNNKKSKQMQ